MTTRSSSENWLNWSFRPAPWKTRVRRMEVSQPNRVLATPEFKVDDETRTELKANSLSAGYWRTSMRNFSSTRRGFLRKGFSRHRRFESTPLRTRVLDVEKYHE